MNRPTYLQRIDRRIFTSQGPTANRIAGVLLAVALGIFSALLLVHELSK